jgi:hypothetical protein
LYTPAGVDFGKIKKIAPPGQQLKDQMRQQGGGQAKPTPQTHTFSLSAWQKANPKGDVNAAKTAAQAAGYQVAP